MKRKILSLMLALVMCLTMALPCFAAETNTASKFDDVPADAWYAEAVNALAEGGILAGKGNGKFDPNANITMAELSVIGARLQGREVRAKNAYEPVYGDNGTVSYRVGDTSHWAGWALEWAHLGSTNYWWPDFAFADEPAYRGDAITMLGGFARSHSEDNGAASFDFDNSIIGDYDEWFPDMNHNDVYGEVSKTIGTYTKGGHNIDAGRIRAAYCYGVISGIDAKGSCAPYKTLTRAEVAQMCYNMGWTTAGCLK